MMPRCIYTLLLLVVVLPLLLLYSSLVDLGDAVQVPSSAATSEPGVLLLRQLKRYHGEAAVRNPVYSNDWAVQVYGGEEAADELAALHGFINMGKVAIIIKKISPVSKVRIKML
jgi:hypothetical protein